MHTLRMLIQRPCTKIKSARVRSHCVERFASSLLFRGPNVRRRELLGVDERDDDLLAERFGVAQHGVNRVVRAFAGFEL